MLKIYLFGRIRLQHDQLAIDAKITHTVQALLAYLLIQPNRTYPRDALVEIGWGDRPQDQARSCLNTALWRLRNILEPDGVRRGSYLLTNSSGDVGFNWNSDYWMDVSAFEQTAASILVRNGQIIDDRQAAALEEITALYHGDMLEGMYYDWALDARERKRATYLSCLSSLLRYYNGFEHYDQAIATAQKILHHDPLREEVHRSLITIYVKYGQRSLALQQYETCRTILQNELGIAPMPETRILHDQIMAEAAGEIAVTGAGQGSPPAPLRKDSALAAYGQAISHLTRVLAELDEVRSEVKRTLALLNQHHPE